MNELTLLKCPDCNSEMKLPKDIVEGKEIRCYCCGKRMPYSDYINPEADLQAEKQAEAAEYKDRLERALEEEKVRKASAMEKYNERKKIEDEAKRLQKLAEEKAEEERRRKEEEEERKRREAEAEARRRKEEEERKRREAEAEARRRKEDEERKRREAEAEARRRKEEEERKRREAEAEARRHKEEEERKRREVEAEARRRKEDEERQMAWKAEGRYAKIGALILQNGDIRQIKAGHNTLGRGVDASIPIERENLRLSRVHLSITVQGSESQGFIHEAALVKKEVNETRINDTRMVYGQTYRLRHGDTISLPSGQIEIKFVVS